MADPQLQSIPKQHTVVADTVKQADGKVVTLVLDSVGGSGVELRPYQREAMEKLSAVFKERHVPAVFPYRYGVGNFAKSGGGQSRPSLQIRQAWAAGVVNVEHMPVRTISGLWEARKTPMYYHVQLALSLWHT